MLHAPSSTPARPLECGFDFWGRQRTTSKARGFSRSKRPLAPSMLSKPPTIAEPWPRRTLFIPMSGPAWARNRKPPCRREGFSGLSSQPGSHAKNTVALSRTALPPRTPRAGNHRWSPGFIAKRRDSAGWKSYAPSKRTLGLACGPESSTGPVLAGSGRSENRLKYEIVAG